MSGCGARNGCGSRADNTSEALDKLARLEWAANEVLASEKARGPNASYPPAFSLVSAGSLGQLERVLTGEDEPSQKPCRDYLPCSQCGGQCKGHPVYAAQQGQGGTVVINGREFTVDHWSIVPASQVAEEVSRGVGIDCRTPPPDTIEQIAEKRRRQRDDARDERDEARKELKECRRERDCLRSKLEECEHAGRRKSQFLTLSPDGFGGVFLPPHMWTNGRPVAGVDIGQDGSDKTGEIVFEMNGAGTAAELKRLRAENAELAERNTAINEMLAKAEHKAEQAAAEAKGILNNLGMLADAVFAYINNPLLKNLTTLTTFAQDARRKATHQQATPQESHS